MSGRPTPERRWWVRLLLAGVVVAGLAGTGAGPAHAAPPAGPDRPGGFVWADSAPR
jgi:hypothetical protein